MFRKFLSAAILIAACSGAMAESSQLGAGQVWGNSTAAARYGRPENVTAIIDRAFGSTRGSVLRRGASGWAIVAPSATALPWVSNGVGADPAYQRLTFVGLPQGIANSIWINPTGSTADMQNVAIPACANDGSHGLVYISGTGLQCATLTIGGTVTTITAGKNINLSSGATCTVNCTIDALVTNATRQKFLSGSGTYTTPANVRAINIRMKGGGSGGGSGNGTGSNAGGNTCWNTSGAACTTPVYQAGGAVGAVSASTSAVGAVGGTVSGSGTCDVAIAGSDGDSATISLSGSIAAKGGKGGGTGAGSGGLNSSAGTAAKANSGSGGGGGGESSAATAGAGPGGGEGAYCEVRIASPAATYTYAVGTGSAGSVAPGAGGQNGGDGGSGGVWVEETY